MYNTNSAQFAKANANPTTITTAHVIF
jgi:hypothetical protein